MKYPPSFFILGLVILVAVACGGQSPGNDEAVVPSPTAGQAVTLSPQSGSFFEINEVGLGPNGFVALTNFTDVPASLAGLYICQGSECFELPDAVVGPGQTARIAVGDGSGLEDVVSTGATLGELRPSDGEIALVASPALDDPRQMYNYLQWGSTPHELTETAVEAGLWIETGYAPSSDTATRLFRVPETGLWLFDEP